MEKFSTNALPFVFINMAMTADGKIATANRIVSSFGSRRDLTHLYELRATADAVMAGARTIEINDVKLGAGGRRFENARLRRGLARHNLRVIVSGTASIDPHASIFQHRFSPIVIVTTERAPAARRKVLAGLADEVFIGGADTIDFVGTLRHLRNHWNVRRLLCEGGGELNDALFRKELIDEINLTICPKIFGGRNAPTIADGRGAASLAEVSRFQFHRMRRIGDELFVVLRRAHRS